VISLMFNLFKKQPQPVVDVPILDRGVLVPRIRHLNFLEALKAQGVPPEQMPVTLPLCGELLVTFAFDLPDQFVMATPPLLAQAGIVIDELAALSQANLKGRFSAQILRTDHDGLMRVEAGDAFEAVLLIFDSFWDGHVRSLLTGDIVAAAPRRDVLLIADAAVSGAVGALREQAAAALEGSTDAHGLSVQAMLRHGGAWKLLPRESA
jgi:hypothetical protein